MYQERLGNGRRNVLMKNGEWKTYRAYKRHKMGKAGELQYNSIGCYLETTLPQFVLKYENASLYDKAYKGLNGESGNENFYDIYITGEMIKKKDYRYIEYVPTKKEKYPLDVLDFTRAYKEALILKAVLGVTINIFIFDNQAYYLDSRYENVEPRRFFKSIEKNVLGQKYAMGIKKKVKQGAFRSSKMQDKIIKHISGRP